MYHGRHNVCFTCLIHVVCRTSARSLTLESIWKYLIFYYPVPHVVCRTTFMKRGVWLLLIWKLTGSPPLMWWISIFLYLGIRGLLFRTIWCLPFWNRRKIERLTQFPKKSPNPPKMVENCDISENRGGSEVFFEIAWIAQFLFDFNKDGSKLFRRAIPFFPDAKKLVSTTLGGGSPWTFSLPLKNCWYENWRAPPPLMWWISFFFFFPIRG